MIARQEHDTSTTFSVASDEPLIAIPLDEHGVERVLYFTSDAEADAYIRTRRPAGPVSMAGIWSELDANDMLDRLDRIRHESSPTPPLENI